MCIWAENLAEFILLSFLYISQKSFDEVKNWIEQHNEQQVKEDRERERVKDSERERGSGVRDRCRSLEECFVFYVSRVIR